MRSHIEMCLERTWSFTPRMVHPFERPILDLILSVLMLSLAEILSLFAETILFTCLNYDIFN